MRYFAIGGKDFIEIRAASEPPRKVVTTASKVITQRGGQRFAGYTLYGEPTYQCSPPQKIKRTIKNTIFKGGKTVKFLRSFPFMPPALGEVLELTPEQVKTLGVG